MKLHYFLATCFIACFFQFCQNATESKNFQTASKDSIAVKQTEIGSNTPVVFQTHLKDTTTLDGSFILFLIPDSARFGSYEEDSGIFDADADFGVGMSNTIDSISKNARYKNIRIYTSYRKYIHINNCIGCPKIIDRDTVNYGIILSAPGKKVVTKYNEVHSGDYLQDVDDYFGLNKE